MKLLIDYVTFSTRDELLARIWLMILPRLAKYIGWQIFVLNRGGFPSVPGIREIAFPLYTGKYTAADSLLIEKICKDLGIDIFVSTWYTTPLSVPSVLVIYDVIPEFDVALNSRLNQEKEIAIGYASHYAFMSHNTEIVATPVHPKLINNRVFAVPYGIDRSVFYTRNLREVQKCKSRLNIRKSYYLLVGAPENASPLLNTIRTAGDDASEIVCLGSIELSTSNMGIHFIALTGDDLACAYSGAEALICYSSYEGVGISVIEAQVCGCPVIINNEGDESPRLEGMITRTSFEGVEFANAIRDVRNEKYRRELISKAAQLATVYDWDVTAQRLAYVMKQAFAEGKIAASQKFFQEWKRLRTIQADVDVGR